MAEEIQERAPTRASEAAAELLRDLGRAVADAWPDEPGRERAASELDHLVGYIASGERTDPERDGDRLLQRRLLEALRLEALRRWKEGSRDPGRASTHLEVLLLLEEAGKEKLPRDARDLASRLADPDGFELLVEVAHDLRSPLTSVSFLAETLRSGFSGELNDQQHHQLGLIYSAALAMQSVVVDVVDLAREGTDVVSEPEAPFSLREVFEQVGRLVQPIAEVKGVELRLEPPDHDRFRGRPAALQRLLLNLVTNGLKFTDRGYVAVMAQHVGRDRVEISVRDTGRGIDPENQAAIFEPFRKARERPGSFFSGSGLGLSIARRLVRALGSELDFETRPDWGTRFFFELHLPGVDHY